MFSVRFGIKSGIISRNGFQTLLHTTELCKCLSSFTIKNSEYTLFKAISNNKWRRNSINSFSTEQFTEPTNPDVFGAISGKNYEKIELDDDEKEQEEFEKNESTISRRFKLSPGGYARLISDHIAKGDLNSAINVLEIIKQNRDKPTTHMFNLLMRGYAVHGDLKKCFKLYNDIKKRALKPSAATYTSIFNACANSTDREMAIEILNNVRHEILQKNIPLNETHYNVMIKAYGKHQLLFEAFQLVDEMVDKRMSTDVTTFNSLMFASISNKPNGLKHTLTVWHLMQQRRIKPSILTYNLLLRAIRDTELGDIKINDLLVENIPNTRILLSDDTTPNLLGRPPIVTRLSIDSIINLPAPVEDRTEYKSSSAPVVYNNNDKKIEKKSSPTEIFLNDIHVKNRLILFGGYTGFIERMESDNIKPDVKTLTLLLDVVPSSLKIEKHIIQIARAEKIQLNIDFFNMLIKKRSSRRDYQQAKKVLDEIQLHGLIPNIVTWGVLAMGCQSHTDARALLDGMDATGHPLNPIIATTLLNNACSINHFVYIYDMLEIMYKNRIKPTELTYKVLDKFQSRMTDIVLNKVKSKHSNDVRYKELFSKFNLRYSSWQQQFGRTDYSEKKKNKK